MFLVRARRLRCLLGEVHSCACLAPVLGRAFVKALLFELECGVGVAETLLLLYSRFLSLLQALLVQLACCVCYLKTLFELARGTSLLGGVLGSCLASCIQITNDVRSFNLQLLLARSTVVDCGAQVLVLDLHIGHLRLQLLQDLHHAGQRGVRRGVGNADALWRPLRRSHRVDDEAVVLGYVALLLLFEVREESSGGRTARRA